VSPSPAQAAAGAAIIVIAGLHALLPHGSVGRAGLYVAASVVVVAQAVRGFRRLAPHRRGPWTPVLVGLLITVITDVVLAVWRAAGATVALPHVIHLLYPVGAATLAVGVTAMVRRGTRPDRAALIDALLVTTSLALVVGVVLVRPLGPEFTETPMAFGYLLSFSGAHLLLLVAAIRFALTAPWPYPAGRRLVAGVLALPLMATGVGVLLMLGTYEPGTDFDLGWLAAYLLIAQALSHRSASDLAGRRVMRETPGAGRVVLISAVLVLLPALQLVLARTGTEVVVAGGTAILLALIMSRVGLLLRDVQRSQSRRLRLEQERGQRRLTALLRHASDVLLVVDAHDRVSHATPSASALLGRDPTGWSSEELLAQVHPVVRDDVRREVAGGLAHADGRAIRFQTRLLDRDERERHVEVVTADLRDDPDVQGTVLTFHDLTERVELEHRLRHLAFHDALTGLCNRELFQDRLVHGLRRARREGQRVAVLVCDLDDFKDVNDTHGHATGDTLLRQLADRLRAAARVSDTVARLGGDEFAIVCEGLDRTRDAIDVARRVLTATSEPVAVGDRELSIGVSVGIAVDDGHRSAEELLRDADIALYEAKDDGKQRWALHEQSMTVRAQQRLQLATDLARAVAEQEIETAFQPIVTLDDQQIVGVEVLARWEHPEHGWVAPSEFIRIAEQSGLIIELGDAVLDAALGSLRGWLDERPELVLRVGVNVSGRQMRDPGLPGRVARKLDDLNLDPAMLVLELTESVMLDEADLAIEVMHELRQLGVRFAVDDFGTGYSSLAYLQRLPVSIIKTDRAFVHALERDDGAEDLVRAIVEMARSLRLDVVAEGVETTVQHEALTRLGCRFGQGHHFGRPVSASALGRRLLAPDTPVVTQPVAALPPTSDVRRTPDDQASVSAT
jgi:diguanylate cyclase (GGDEF)-like protein/PAS domain S-box-containing protein